MYYVEKAQNVNVKNRNYIRVLQTHTSKKQNQNESHYRNIKEEPPNSQAPFCISVWFHGKLFKSKLHTNLEFASFSHCRNIKGNHKILRISSSPVQCPLFLWCAFMTGLCKSKPHAQFEIASFSHCRNNKGKPQKFYRARRAQCYAHFSSVILWCSMAKRSCTSNLNPLHNFIHIGNISEFWPKILVNQNGKPVR